MDNKRVGALLRSLRGNLSLADVAEHLGITVSALAMYERGERTPRDEVKERIAHFYGRSVGSIFFAEFEHAWCSISEEGGVINET